jgi:DNA-binding IclR family transcriptional regulator
MTDRATRQDGQQESAGSLTDASGVRSVRRALEILSLIDDHNPSIALRDVLTRTDLAKTTAIRLLQTLESSGVLWQTSEGRYVPGPSLLRWARLSAQAWRLPRDTARRMSELAARCQETVNIYVRQGTQRVCLAQYEGPLTLRHIVEVGDQLPLWGGASAKVLLLDADDALLRRIAAGSPSGASHLTTLQAGIREVRETGYAVSHGEREQGASSVAVPIRSRGKVVAALAVGGPTARFTPDRVTTFVEELLAAAEAVPGQGFEHLAESTG